MLFSWQQSKTVFLVERDDLFVMLLKQPRYATWQWTAHESALADCF